MTGSRLARRVATMTGGRLHLAKEELEDMERKLARFGQDLRLRRQTVNETTSEIVVREMLNELAVTAGRAINALSKLPADELLEMAQAADRAAQARAAREAERDADRRAGLDVKAVREARRAYGASGRGAAWTVAARTLADGGPVSEADGRRADEIAAQVAGR